MCNNAAVTVDGGEIGRAQALQALACRAAPVVDMNPVLLKPQCDTGAQVVVRGRMHRRAQRRATTTARKRELLAVVLASSTGLAARVRLRRWSRAPAARPRSTCAPATSPTWASRWPPACRWCWSATSTGAALSPPLVGTRGAARRRRARAASAASSSTSSAATRRCSTTATARSSAHTGWPDLGRGALARRQRRGCRPRTRVALERPAAARRRPRSPSPCRMLPRIANFDDFDPLRAGADSTCAIPPGRPSPAGDADLVSCPEPRRPWPTSRPARPGLGRRHPRAWRRGGRVLGICGGYQMLGRRIADPPASRARRASGGLGAARGRHGARRRRRCWIARRAGARHRRAGARLRDPYGPDRGCGRHGRGALDGVADGA